MPVDPNKLQAALAKQLLTRQNAPAPEPAAEPAQGGRAYGDLSLGEKAGFHARRFLDPLVNFGQGATLGFGDEMAAAVFAPVEMATGGGSLGDAYDRALGNVRGAIEGAEARSGPIGTGVAKGTGATATAFLGGGTVQGAKAVPAALRAVMSGTAPAAGTLGRLGAGVGSGALYGAAMGAGEGEGAEERRNLAAFGGTVGAVAPVAISAASAPIRALARGPGAKASARLAQAVRRSGQTPQQIDDAVRTGQEMGQPFTPADAMGKSGGMALSGAARQPGRGQQFAADFLENRQTAQSERVSSMLDDALRPKTVVPPRLQSRPAPPPAPAAPKALRGPGGNPNWPEEMHRPALSPEDIAEEREAMRWAAEALQRERALHPDYFPAPKGGVGARAGNTGVNFVEGGLDDVPTPQTADEYVEALRRMRGDVADASYGAVREGAGAVDVTRALQAVDDQLPTVPAQRSGNAARTLQRARGLLVGRDGQPISDFAALQQAKTEIDTLIERAEPTVRRQLMPVKTALVEAMEASSPGYRAANVDFRRFSEAMDAVDRGRKAVRPSSRAAENVRTFEQLPEEGQAAFRTGYLDRALAKVENASPGTNVARQFTSPKAQAEIGTMDPTRRVAQALMREDDMVRTANTAVGGSRTADNLAAIEDISAAAGAARDLTHGNVLGAAGRLVGGTAQRLFGPGEATRDALVRQLLSTTPGTVPKAVQDAIRRELGEETLQRILDRGATAAAIGARRD